MRKNVKALSVMIVLILTMFCCTGCLRFRTSMRFKNNGKTDLAIIYAYHEMLLGDNGLKSIEDVVEAFDDEGWTVKDYEKGDYQGYLFTMSDVKISDLEDVLNSDAFEKIGFGDFDLTRSGLTYTINWELGTPEEFQNESLCSSDLSAYGGFIEIVIELPSPAKSENATDVDDEDKKLTWDLLEEDEVELSFTLINTGLIVTIAAVVGVLLVSAVVVVLVIILKKKKPAKSEKAAPAVPQGPVSSAEPANPIDFTSPIPPPVTSAPLVPAAYLPEQPGDDGSSGAPFAHS